MRWLRILKERGVAAQQEESRSGSSRYEASDVDPSVVLVYSAFGWYYMETNPDPMEPHGLLMKVA